MAASRDNKLSKPCSLFSMLNYNPPPPEGQRVEIKSVLVCMWPRGHVIFKPAFRSHEGRVFWRRLQSLPPG